MLERDQALEEQGVIAKTGAVPLASIRITANWLVLPIETRIQGLVMLVSRSATPNDRPSVAFGHDFGAVHHAVTASGVTAG